MNTEPAPEATRAVRSAAHDRSFAAYLAVAVGPVVAIVVVPLGAMVLESLLAWRRWGYGEWLSIDAVYAWSPDGRAVLVPVTLVVIAWSLLMAWSFLLHGMSARAAASAVSGGMLLLLYGVSGVLGVGYNTWLLPYGMWACGVGVLAVFPMHRQVSRPLLVVLVIGSIVAGSIGFALDWSHALASNHRSYDVACLQQGNCPG